MKHNFSSLRNRILIERYKKGDKIRVLEDDFSISKQRIYQILDKNGVKKRIKLDIKTRPAIIKKNKPKEQLYDKYAKPIR